MALLVGVAAVLGYLFLQAPKALTDVSGIVYSTGGNNPETTGLMPGELSRLGGPW